MKMPNTSWQRTGKSCLWRFQSYLPPLHFAVSWLHRKLLHLQLLTFAVMWKISRKKFFQTVILAPMLIYIFIGCSHVRNIEEDIDGAIAALNCGVTSFEDITRILEGLKDKLDDGSYKDQVEGLIRTTGQVAQLNVQGSVDFIRTRIVEDLENLKRSVLGKPPLTRVGTGHLRGDTV
jgi:hypothetical protein